MRLIFLPLLAVKKRRVMLSAQKTKSGHMPRENQVPVHAGRRVLEIIARGDRDTVFRQSGLRATERALIERATRTQCGGAGSEARRRLLSRRPSDRRGPGMDPRPQYAFKMSMFNVSCNSH